MTEQAIKSTANLYKCRNSMKRLFGEKYPEKIRPYRNVIEAHKKKFNIDTLPSVIELCSMESVRDNEMAIILFMAAAVEIIEAKA